MHARGTPSGHLQTGRACKAKRGPPVCVDPPLSNPTPAHPHASPLAGCLNGGGQPKPAAGQTTAQLLEALETLYGAGLEGSSAAAGDPCNSGSNGSSGGSSVSSTAPVQRLYAEWVGGPPGSEAARRLLHTQYHKREKTVTATLADW